MEQHPVMLRAAEIARLLGVSVERTYQLLRDRELPGIRVGGGIRVPRAAWERWLEQQTKEALAGLREGARGRERGSR